VPEVRHTPVRLLYRYGAGRPLDGYDRTGGGYLRRGTAFTAWGRAPGWQRQAWRLGVPAALLGAHQAYAVHPVPTVESCAVLGAVGAVKGGRALRRAWRTRRFRAVYIRPTLGALRTALGDAPVRLHVDPGLGNLLPRLAKPMSPAEKAVRAWYGEHLEPVVRWAPDQAQRAGWAVQRFASPATRRLALFRRPVEAPDQRIELRATVPFLTAEQRSMVEAIVSAKIPAGELVKTWDQVGTQVTATWTVRRRPPARVGYADLAGRLDQLPEHEFFLGLGVGGKPVVVSLHEDSPHFAISAGSGAGKSVLAQLIAVQVLARGGQVTLLDIKGSHRWALGMQGVDYCTRPEQMHHALLRLATLADDRNQAILFEDEGWDPGPRHLIVAEELNATMARIRDWWEDTRVQGQPKAPPAIRAFRFISATGRAAKVNEVAIAQMLSANAAGGPEARENFGIRCLARYTRNNWQMLVPEASMPRASRTLGRWQIVVAGEAIETQVCYLSTAEARLLVHKGRAAVHMPADTLDGRLTRDVHMDVDRPRPLTLQDSIDEGVCPWPLATVQKRLQRARAAGSTSVPAPVGKRQRADLYDRVALIAWFESELVP
jgi:hypothetical protein